MIRFIKIAFLLFLFGVLVAGCKKNDDTPEATILRPANIVTTINGNQDSKMKLSYTGELLSKIDHETFNSSLLAWELTQQNTYTYPESSKATVIIQKLNGGVWVNLMKSDYMLGNTGPDQVINSFMSIDQWKPTNRLDYTYQYNVISSMSNVYLAGSAPVEISRLEVIYTAGMFTTILEKVYDTISQSWKVAMKDTAYYNNGTLSTMVTLLNTGFSWIPIRKWSYTFGGPFVTKVVFEVYNTETQSWDVDSELLYTYDSMGNLVRLSDAIDGTEITITYEPGKGNLQRFIIPKPYPDPFWF